MLPDRNQADVTTMVVRTSLANTALAWILTFAPAFAGWSQAAPPITQSIASAIRAKQFDHALELARQALKTAPNDVPVLTLEALAFKELGQEQNALAAFHRALQLSPDYLAALEGAAQIEYAAGSDRAIPLLDHLLKLKPNEPTAHAMRAVMAWKHHDCETAALHFEQGRSVAASQPDALTEFGICLVRLKKTGPAEDVFRQLVTQDPANRRARYSLASVQMIRQRNQEALDSLQPLMEAGDPDPEALALASSAYEAMGDTPKAVSTLRQAIVVDPGNPSYYLDFAALSLAHASYEAGIQMINAGLKLSPGSPKLHLARGILYVQLGQIDQADADFATSERLDPEQPGASAARVLKYLQQNNMEEALKTVHEEMAGRPNDGFLYYLLGEVLNWQGPPAGTPEFQKALDAASTAVRLQPDLTLARNLLSRLYLDAGQVNLAIEQCRLVLRDNPQDPVALYRLMRALKSTGNPEDAKQIPELLRKFNEARQLASKQAAQENRYKLVEGSAAGVAK
jgi:tetratricopeptide (TPR) repeat protein